MATTTLIYLGLGILVLLILAWAVWKFFKSLFKYFIVGVVVVALGVGLTIYRLLPPPRNPAIGKHAYLKENGKYLGVVESMGEDSRRGPVWGIRPPGGYPTAYGRSRVILKEKYEPPTPPPEPSPTVSPEKKVEKKKGPPAKK